MMKNTFLPRQKEKCYLTVISNLLKKNNFLELLQLKDTGQITEDEFEKKLESDFEKYSIHIKDDDGGNNRYFVFDIAGKIYVEMKKIGMEDVSTDSMAELFSLTSEVFYAKERDNM